MSLTKFLHINFLLINLIKAVREFNSLTRMTEIPTRIHHTCVLYSQIELLWLVQLILRAAVISVKFVISSWRGCGHEPESKILAERIQKPWIQIIPEV